MLPGFHLGFCTTEMVAQNSMGPKGTSYGGWVLALLAEITVVPTIQDLYKTVGSRDLADIGLNGFDVENSWCDMY